MRKDEKKKRTIKLSCLIGLHAWYQGKCVNCGKVK